MVFLKEFFEKVDFEKKTADNKKALKGIPSECQRVCIQIILSSLIWVQTVCKGYQHTSLGYQQTSLADKELKGGLEKIAISTLSYRLAFIVCVHIRSISVRHEFMEIQYKNITMIHFKIASYVAMAAL